MDNFIANIAPPPTARLVVALLLMFMPLRAGHFRLISARKTPSSC